MKFLRLLLPLVLASSTMSCAADVAKVSPAIAAERVAAGQALLIDVREPDEWADTGVATPALLLPMSDFNGDQKLWKPFLEKHAGQSLILYCRSGNRSGKVAAALAEKGFKVANAGAFKDWAAADLPVTQPAKK